MALKCHRYTVIIFTSHRYTVILLLNLHDNMTMKDSQTACSLMFALLFLSGSIKVGQSLFSINCKISGTKFAQIIHIHLNDAQTTVLIN